jgi:hypothetical protein
MLQLGFGFDHKETNQTDGDLNRSPQQWQKAHNHMSHAIYFSVTWVLLKQKESNTNFSF